MQPKVSVIIPVYKAEKFIEKCVRSLFEQTLDNIEYIFVNDCSPDESVSILKNSLQEYPNRRPLVKIINHQNNCGVSKSRQDGLEASTGEFIIHCDSDDWAEPEMYELMYNEGFQNNADVVMCEYYTNGVNTQYYSSRFEYDTENNGNMNFTIAPLYGAVWNKLVKRNLFHEHKISFFEEINMGEDLGVSLQLRYFSKKTIIIHKALYHHSIINENSIYTNFSDSKSNQIVICANKLESLFKGFEDYDNFYFRLQYLKFQSKYEYINNPKIRNLKKWKRIYPETHSYILKFEDVPLNIKVVSWFAANGMDIIALMLLKIKEKFINRR